jgi:hypothetical protein
MPVLSQTKQLSLRLRKLVESNAQRLARRICKKGALGSNEIKPDCPDLQPASIGSRGLGAAEAPSLEDEPALLPVPHSIGNTKS